MIIDTANRRNLNFLLLFGVFFSLDGLESKADPVFSVYNSKVSNVSNPRDIVKAKNNIYINDFKRLHPRSQKNNLFKKVQRKNNLKPNYQNSIYQKKIVDNTDFGATQSFKNDIYKKWNSNAIEAGLDDQMAYMDGYKSRLYPFHGHVFYDHYHSEMQSTKKEHHSFRKFLHNFRLHFSTGGNATFDKTSVTGFFFKENGNYYLSPLFQGEFANSAYQIGWFGESYKKTSVTIPSSKYSTLEAGEKVFAGWIRGINFLTVGLSYDIYERLRLEIDYSFKGHHISKLKRHYQVSKDRNTIHAKATAANLDFVSLPKKDFFSSDLGFLIGAKVINNTFWSLILNFQIYCTFFYKNFKVVEGTFAHGLNNSLPGLGCGMTLEKHLSDYMSLFVKGMFGVSKFGWSDDQDRPRCKVNHSMSTFSLDFGINFTSSYIDKCDREEGCKIKEVHIHNSKEYRGLNKWEYKSPYGKVIHSAK